MLEVPSIQDLNALRQDLEQLKREMQAELSELKRRELPLPQWLNQAGARKHFTGSNGEPVDPKTFRKMVLSWLKDKEVLNGVDYRYENNVLYISSYFIQGAKRTVKLRKAS